MCESCSSGVNRREFLAGTSLTAAAALSSSARAADKTTIAAEPIAKRAARVRVVFLYPPLKVVEAGELEDGWAKHNWSTWPGNQFQPEAQHKKFADKITGMAKAIGIDAELLPESVYTSAGVERFIAETKAAKPAAVLVVNFWNTFSKWSYQITQEVDCPSIVYHTVGSNHQLPPKDLMKAEGVYYIHSIENWEEIDRALRAVHAKTMLAQSRMLRVADYPEAADRGPGALGVHVTHIPADEYNALFDSIQVDDAIRKQAEAYRGKATKVHDVTDHYVTEGFRAHRAVEQLLQRHGADAVTIRCLMLKERKPCISFSLNNGRLTPCGCENDYNATLTMMLGRWLFERGGFQHNPEFDTSRNQYFGAHCTCATRLAGPDGPEQDFWIRPFFHQLPKTAALDVQWTPGAPALLAKYTPDRIHAWTGKVISSPSSPPTGGCATRALIEIDGVDDVCSVYPGPHPVLYQATPDEAKRLRAFARLYRMPLQGNV